MELYVFDLEFNRLGLVDDFIDLKINPCYDSLGTLSMTVDGSMFNLLQSDRILVKSTDMAKGYIIKTKEYIDEKTNELYILAPSLNVILNDRWILGQQEFTGTIERVFKSFVDVNCIHPSNPNRIIPNLIVSSDNGLDITTSEVAVDEPLCDYLYELCKKHDVSFDVLLDHENKKFVFDVWQGVDRTTEQDINPHVIFAEEFDNVLRQNYTEIASDLKTTAVVLGEKIEGQVQEIVTINDDKAGFERKEILVSSNAQKTYTDENDKEVTLTDSEYRLLLEESGKNTLAERKIVKSFESDVDGKANFVYGVDYFTGDKVSIRNDKLGIIMHTRIISSDETENQQGSSLKLNFGNDIPSFIDKVKRAVKR